MPGSRRQDVVNVISATRVQKEPFEEARENLSEVAARLIDVGVAGETPMQQNNPRGFAAAFAVLLGLVAAFAAVQWLAARRRKNRPVG